MIAVRCLGLLALLTGACGSPARECGASVDCFDGSSNPAASATESAELSLAPHPEFVPLRAAACSLQPGGGLPLAPEAEFLSQGERITGHRPPCRAMRHATAGARNSMLEITLKSWHGLQSAQLSAHNLAGQTLVSQTMVEVGESISVLLENSGELFIELEPVDPQESANAYALEVHCVAGCGAEFTRFPVVLMHGLGGTDNFGEEAYFYRVVEELEPLGFAFHVPRVTPFSSIHERARQWTAQLDDLIAQGAARRFNLIAHSQGGLDARAMISRLNRSDLVASLVTIGTPHRGTPLADIFYDRLGEDPSKGRWVDRGTAAFARLFGLQDANNSLVDALSSLTVEALAEFNERTPNHADVYYASWAGLTCGLLDFSCQRGCRGETVHLLLEPTHILLRLQGLQSDGMVPVESAVWGDFRGQICADHIDEVALFGDSPTRAFDHLAFYLAELRRLASLEL